jgi:cytochrome c oxidase subunit 2
MQGAVPPRVRPNTAHERLILMAPRVRRIYTLSEDTHFMNHSAFLRGLIFSGIVLVACAAADKAESAQTITISAHRFAFEPNEITVKKGQEVTLILQSQDVTHGLVIEGLTVRTEVKKGQSTEVKFTPQSAGTFNGKCAHFCGSGHGQMTFTVHVVE